MLVLARDLGSGADRRPGVACQAEGGKRHRARRSLRVTQAAGVVVHRLTTDWMRLAGETEAKPREIRRGHSQQGQAVEPRQLLIGNEAGEQRADARVAPAVLAGRLLRGNKVLEIGEQALPPAWPAGRRGWGAALATRGLAPRWECLCVHVVGRPCCAFCTSRGRSTPKCCTAARLPSTRPPTSSPATRWPPCRWAGTALCSHSR